MKVWKRVLIIVPAGLTLGVIGGHFARPVMTQRPGDDAVQRMLRSRGDSGSETAQVDLAYEDGGYYNGGPSYLPAVADDDRTITGWQGPDFAGWPDYKPAPLPTLTQLEAEVAARDAALGDRALAGAEARTEEGSVDEAAAEAPGNRSSDQSEGEGAAYPQTVSVPPAASPSTTTPEPRTADGKLPAIW